MVDIKFWEKNYMVDNKIIQIIRTNLKEYIVIDDVKAFPSNGSLKYIFRISSCYFEIIYSLTDNFYRIKLEKIINNETKDVIFLTKSKRFQKDIKLKLKNLKLSKKVFENHIYAFTNYISEILKKYENLNYFDQTYISDMKFDGYFI